jgi:hypothetical protein
LTGIDNFGDIVGEFLGSDNKTHGLVISGGVQHPFDAPGATNTLGWGINDHKQVVGYTDLPDKEVGFASFNGKYIFLSAPGRTVTHALKINNSGSIVGFYQGTDNIEHGFLRTQ